MLLNIPLTKVNFLCVKNFTLIQVAEEQLVISRTMVWPVRP